MPILLIVVAGIAGLFLIRPLYADVEQLSTENAAYSVALENGKAFDDKLDVLIGKKSQFSPDELDHLEKMIPGKIDNVRLVVEINELARKFGTGIKNVKITDAKPDSPDDQNIDPYGSVALGFSVTIPYAQFTQFLKALESNLRLADVTTLSFKPNDLSNTYDFNVTVRTYWLKPLK